MQKQSMNKWRKQIIKSYLPIQVLIFIYLFICITTIDPPVYRSCMRAIDHEQAVHRRRCTVYRQSLPAELLNVAVRGRLRRALAVCGYHDTPAGVELGVGVNGALNGVDAALSIAALLKAPWLSVDQRCRVARFRWTIHRYCHMTCHAHHQIIKRINPAWWPPVKWIETTVLFFHRLSTTWLIM